MHGELNYRNNLIIVVYEGLLILNQFTQLMNWKNKVISSNKAYLFQLILVLMILYELMVISINFKKYNSKD